MDIQDLRSIEREIERFQIRVKEAITRSLENKGFEMMNYDTGEPYICDVGNISGTKESGAVKRAALDLKRELTKITK